MPTIERRPKAVNETTVSSEIRAACNSIDGVRLFRNNNGKLKDETGRWVTYGLADGSADLVGSVKVCIRSPTELGGIRHVVIARPFALEIKDPKRRYEHRETLVEQRRWHNAVRALGWYTGSNVASIDEALEHVRRAGLCNMQGPVDDWDANRGRCPFCHHTPDVSSWRRGSSVFVPHECAP